MGQAPRRIPEASPGQLPPLLDTVLGSHPSSHSQSYGFSSSQIQIWELDHKEIWAPKNWCFWTVVLEKTLESPLDCKEIKPVNPKGNQSWIFIGRTDAEVEAPTLRPPDVKSRHTRKDPGAEKDWGQKEKGVTEVGWHHWLNGHEFEQIPGDSEGQGSLACCSPWGHKTSRHNWVTEQQPSSPAEVPVASFEKSKWNWCQTPIFEKLKKNQNGPLCSPAIIFSSNRQFFTINRMTGL